MDSKDIIYLDHAATVPMRPEAVSAMSAALADVWGNASAIYSAGSRAKRQLERARASLAATIGADPSEIYFTSGGTEGDNWALTAAMEFCSGGHLIITAVEHHAILHTAEYLRTRGFDVTVLPPDSEGYIAPEKVAAAVRPDTALISVMTANNEVGTIEPIAAIGRIARDRHILFHTDAVQAYGKIPIDVRAAGIDLLSVSAHKIGGPKGIGFLYIKKNMPFGAYMHGGMQEKGRRAGTENVPAAVGFAAAAEAVFAEREEAQARERALQRFFLRRLREEIPGVELNGPEPDENGPGPDDNSPEQDEARCAEKRCAEKQRTPDSRRLANNLNVRFPGVNSETLLILLDMQGICASGGSACTTGAVNPSHVLMAMGQTAEEARESVRFTLGPENTEEELERTVQAVKEITERLKKLNR